MRRHVVAAALAACIPVILAAQGKKGGGAAGGDNPSTAATAPAYDPKSPTSHDLGDLNPASLLIGKRKKLALADSQVARLKALEKTINERNAPFMVRYDSVRKWTKPLASAPATTASKPGFNDADRSMEANGASAAELARMQASMRDLRVMMADFRDRHHADDADALALIPEAQKKAAGDLIAQQDADLEKLIGTRK